MTSEFSYAMKDNKFPDRVQLWRVQGVSQVFLTKMEAEKAARVAFPTETADKRYARIFSADFIRELALP